MRDCIELVDLTAYMIGLGLILPAASVLQLDHTWLNSLLVVFVLPMPIYIARSRFALPERVDAAAERFAYQTFITGLFALLFVLTFLLLDA